jgi:hypothetical protein
MSDLDMNYCVCDQGSNMRVFLTVEILMQTDTQRINKTN